MMISIEKEANQSRKTRRVEWMKLIRTKKRRCRQDLVVSFDVYQSSMYDGLCIVYTTSSDCTRLRTWSLSTNAGRCYTNRCITRRIFQMSEYTIRIRLEFDLTERLPIRKGRKFSIILPLWLNSQELRRDPLGRTETNTNTQNKPLSALFFFFLFCFCFFSWNKGKTPERTAWRISKYWCPATRSVGIRSTPRCQPLLIHPLHPFFRTGLLQLPTAQGNWFSPFVPKDRCRHTVFAGSRYDGVGESARRSIQSIIHNDFLRYLLLSFLFFLLESCCCSTAAPLSAGPFLFPNVIIERRCFRSTCRRRALLQ